MKRSLKVISIFVILLIAPYTYSNKAEDETCTSEHCDNLNLSQRDLPVAKIDYIFKNMSEKPLTVRGFQGSETTHTSVDYKDATIPPDTNYTVTTELSYREGPLLDTNIIRLFYQQGTYHSLSYSAQHANRTTVNRQLALDGQKIWQDSNNIDHMPSQMSITFFCSDDRATFCSLNKHNKNPLTEAEFEALPEEETDNLFSIFDDEDDI